MYYIYKIENIKNHKKYIGLTNNWKRRKNRHFCDLAGNRHENQFLQKEYNIYGKSNFSFDILFSGDVDYSEISVKEEEYIAKYDSYYNGYNQNKGGNFGPSNGGSQLTKSDVFTILAISEFKHRAGQTISDFFDITKTTVSRIVQGKSHIEFYEEYHSLPQNKRKEIFQIFSETNPIDDKVEENHALFTRRKLTEEQCLQVLVNRDYNIFSKKYFANKFNVASYVIHSICNEINYKDVVLKYNRMSVQEKEKIATLLSNGQ